MTILSEIHLLLTVEREYGKVFEKVYIIGFRKAKRLRDILVRAKIADHVKVLSAKYANML